jgi:hypothetical protein
MRQCGECKACCTVLAVPDIGKGEGVPCTSLVGYGCGRYDTRPTSCKSYTCLWRGGLLRDDDRPDKCGVMISMAPIEAKRMVFIAQPVEKGGENKDEAKDVIEWLSQESFVVVRSGASRVIRGPVDEIDEIADFLNSITSKL